MSALFTYHNEKEKHKLNENTLSYYQTSQRYINEFINIQYRKKNFNLTAVNFMFIADFEIFLRDYQLVSNKKPIRNSGTMTHLIRLKKMLNLAVSLEWIVKNPFLSFKIKIKHEEREFLTKTELTKMITKEFALPRLEFVRDIFVFSCYTGLAYIDVAKLTPKNLTIGIDGER